MNIDIDQYRSNRT